jgi:D-lyxose ketol-isomerase
MEEPCSAGLFFIFPMLRAEGKVYKWKQKKIYYKKILISLKKEYIIQMHKNNIKCIDTISTVL